MMKSFTKVLLVVAMVLAMLCPALAQTKKDWIKAFENKEFRFKYEKRGQDAAARN